MQSIRELKKKIQSHLRTYIRYGIGTGRIADHYHGRIFAAGNQAKKFPNIVILLGTGVQTIISGFGKVYEKFLETGFLRDYTGFGQIPANLMMNILKMLN